MLTHNQNQENVDFADAEDDESIYMSETINDADKYLSNNASRVVYQTNNFFLPQIQQMIKSGETINLRPEYQRRLRWTDKKKSSLIESLLLNIPIPPIFLFENDTARYEVMDGQQRMTTIREFLGNNHKLTGLELLSSLNGQRYYDCSPRVQRTLARASISAIVLLLESESVKSINFEQKSANPHLSNLDIRRLIFNRINTGGLNLNPQEIRNALNPGLFNDTVIELTRWKKFTDAFEIPAYAEDDLNVAYAEPERKRNSLFKTMRDCEIVLRYFALRDEENVRGSMRGMLDRAMELRRSREEICSAKAEFVDIFSRLFELFDGRPFRLPPDDVGSEKISVPLYDGLMVAISRMLSSNPDCQFDKNIVSNRLNGVFENSDQYEVIVGRANTSRAVKARVNMMMDVLGE